MMNYKKMLFIIIMMMSTMLTISSNNWIGMWMGMEMNLMAFIPFLSKSKSKKSSKTMMMYFLAQSIGSIVLLFTILINSLIMISPIMMSEFISMMLTVGLLIKLGAAPFHMWMPETMKNMNWMEMMFMMTWQKLAPLFVLSNMPFNNWMFKMSIMLSAIMGAIGGLNMTSMQKLMSYSSINHLSWMLVMMMIKTQWILYLMLYSILVIISCYYFDKNNFNYINQINSSSLMMSEKYIYSSILLSMGGMPPFLGFLPKWMAIDSMIKSNMYLMLTTMIMMSLITLFYYMRLISTLLLMYSTTNKWMMNSIKNNNFIVLFMNLMLPLFIIINSL